MMYKIDRKSMLEMQQETKNLQYQLKGIGAAVEFHGGFWAEYVYVTTNLRVLFENGWLDDLDKYWCEPTELHEKRVSVRFTIDRFTGEEFLRHRKASFNRESTRYVAFVKEKFGVELEPEVKRLGEF